MAAGGETVTLQRGDTPLVAVKGVPAVVCQDGGEPYVDDATTARLLQEAEQAARSGVEVEVRSYAA